MNINKKEEFLKRVDDLFAEIQNWSKEANLVVLSSLTAINEEELGLYDAPELEITTGEGKKIARIVPVGACVIAANGRVDIKGSFDNVIIAHLDKGGPKMITAVRDSNGNELSSSTTPFYKGVDETGWYWIENARNKAHKLNSDLFIELLTEVSDDENF